MIEETTQARLKAADIWAGLCVVTLGVVGLVAAFDIFVPRGFNDFLGPRAFPISISALLVVLGLTLSGRSVTRSENTPPDVGSRTTLLVMSVALAGYLMLFNVLGFTLATVIFLTALFMFLGERRAWVAGVAAVAVALATMAVFSSALNVNLPRGPFGF
jgi:putative tricarboxylic transport membrane protein